VTFGGTAGSSTGASTLGAAGQTGLPTTTSPTSGLAGRPGPGATVAGGGASTTVGAAGKPAVPPAGAAGSPPTSTAGMGAAGMVPTTGGATGEPVIPEVKGECPSLESGSINFMGLNGNIEAGAKPSSPTAPMLLYWHGTASTAGEYALMAGAISNGVKSEGGVVVSFQNTTNKGDCSVSGTFIFCTGDFEVMDQYVACAVKNRNVDPHRIYTSGCSAGGLTATAMAAQRSQYIAAAAPNSGGFTFPQKFNTMYTPALMTIHGAPGQDVVGIDFSTSSATADTAFKQRMGFVINCNHGGGHCGGGSLAGDAWTFMKAHPYGVSPEPWTMLPAGFSSKCEIK